MTKLKTLLKNKKLKRNRSLKHSQKSNNVHNPPNKKQKHPSKGTNSKSKQPKDKEEEDFKLMKLILPKGNQTI